ncbi:lysosome-associated membrane glycoprotein 1 [Bombus pyrosoma]|uniref:lysosome-associated membrane glycoprotein 1 n=1 Tax=Bombus pyrosoma TaxID=396416 RepID=UPI001CB9D322|nr:lysosome-associated membrane glycoprotein 1 [Bombus pyrosoma]
MMSKFLLLLCFTALHVLGEGQENILSKNEGTLTNGTSLQNEQHFETNIPSNKILSPVSVSSPLGTNKNKLKPEEVLTTQSPIQSRTVISNDHQSSAVSVDTSATLSYTNETTTKQILHAAINPAVIQATVNSTLSSHTAGKWVVGNGTDKACIVVQMSVEFNISYINDNKMKSFKVFDIPADNATTKASGYCGKLEQNLTLEWSSKNVTNASMTLHFIRNVTENDYSLHHLELVLPPTNFPNATLNTSVVLAHKAPNFVVKVSNSYRCLKQQTLNLRQNNSNETSGYLTISDLQFQAFKVDNSTVFGLAKDCAFDTPDVVPIAVGCALAGLVVIVLIAYLIGRRRNQAHGYLSM